MAIFLAFDIYGTVIDTAGITQALRQHAGDRAAGFSRAWRSKQLEYAFRRGLMQNYFDFAVCTQQALDFTARQFQVELRAQDRESLLEQYRHLPAFPDALSGLEALKPLPLRLFAFSMGRPDDLEVLLKESGTLPFFEDIISLTDIRVFKPSPSAYAYFHRRAGTDGAESWLVSGNPFDVIGAISSGMRGAWIQRSADTIFDPWEIQPTLTANSLDGLAGAFRERFEPT